MQTHFSDAQLRDPAIAEAAAIIGTCVHYGFCTNTCPTYVLTRDENEFPRGRIDLIRAMLETRRAAGRQDRPASRQLPLVPVLHDDLRGEGRLRASHRPGARAYRAAFQETVRRPCAALSAREDHSRSEALSARDAGGAPREAIAGPVAGPAESRCSTWCRVGPMRTSLRRRFSRPKACGASASRCWRAARSRCSRANINAATIRVLTRCGCDVVVAQGSGCCGSLALHMGREDEAKASARRNVEAWTRELDGEGLDAIVVNASGCGTTVKDYGHLFAQDDLAADARRVASLARDVSEVVSELGLPAPRCDDSVARRLSRSLLDAARPAGDARAACAARRRWLSDRRCAGGAFLLRLGRNLQSPAAARPRRRSASARPAHIASTDPDIVATGNIGCIMQLRRYLEIPVVHSVELLDWATGGPLSARARRPHAARACATKSPSRAHRLRAQQTISVSGETGKRHERFSESLWRLLFGHPVRARRRRGQPQRRDHPALRREHDAGRRPAAGRRRLSRLDGGRAGDRARRQQAPRAALSDLDRQQYRARQPLGVERAGRWSSISGGA